MIKRTPSLRFKGFVDEWEEKEFNAIFETTVPTNTLSRANLTTEKTTIKNIHYGDVLIKFGETVDIKNDTIPYVIDDDKHKFNGATLQNGDIVFADAAEDETVGKAVEITNITDEFVVSGLHTIVARPKEQFAHKYLGYYVNSKAYHDNLLSLMQGIKVLSISKSALSKTSVVYPKEVPEQTKVGNLFNTLDSRIAQQQKKHDALVNVKKALLQKMFPQNGKTLPEVRFKGFAEEWEEKSLGEVAENIVAGGDINKDLICESGKYPVIANALTGEGIVGYYKKEYRIKAPAVTVTGRGDVGHAKARETNFTPVVRLLTITSTLDIHFLENTVNNIDIMIESTGVPQLTVPQLSAYNIKYPKIGEQTKIGNLFKTVDNLIDLNKQKLEKLKNIKKACLEKMFV